MKYKIGQMFKNVEEGSPFQDDFYILASVTRNNVCLISLRVGNRWADPVFGRIIKGELEISNDSPLWGFFGRQVFEEWYGGFSEGKFLKNGLMAKKKYCPKRMIQTDMEKPI